MDKFFKQVYTNADEARNEIFNSLKEKNPGLKPWQIWALYDPWDISLCPQEYTLIPKKYGGKYLARFNSSTEIEAICKFGSFSDLGKFLDEATDNKNAIFEEFNEIWKLSNIEFNEQAFDGEHKTIECYVIWKLEE